MLPEGDRGQGRGNSREEGKQQQLASTAPGYHNISVNFQDKTALNFSIETGFTVETDYSNWKTGNQQILHRWPPFKNKK